MEIKNQFLFGQAVLIFSFGLILGLVTEIFEIGIFTKVTDRSLRIATYSIGVLVLWSSIRRKDN